MLDIRAFHWADIDAIGEPQEGQAGEVSALDWRVMAIANAASGPAWAAVSDGQVIAIGGLQLPWEGRARVWALISQDVTTRQWPFLALGARRMLGQARWLGVKRIEAVVRHGWEPGERLIALLGFHREAVMPAWGPDGGTYSQWVRLV